MRSLTRRGETEDQPRNKRDEQGKQEHFSVDRDRIGVGHVGRNETGENLKSRVGQREADGGAEH